MNRIYYSIREVTGKTGIEPQVLRYWEKEFPMLRPRRTQAGKRLYRERDIKIVLAIRRLRQDEKYTVKGARERLSEDPSLWRDLVVNAETAESRQPSGPDEVMKEMRGMLVELRRLVGGGG
ncbi:MAG: MerR family transcriptional regulator [Candidatus Latescibacteria bacterium]|nr:MerR family transcriptional regulator [Candidatus Latescibacterota bacterium]